MFHAIFVFSVIVVAPIFAFGAIVVVVIVVVIAVVDVINAEPSRAASGESRVPISGSSSENVSPAAMGSIPLPGIDDGVGRAVPTIIVPFVLWI